MDKSCLFEQITGGFESFSKFLGSCFTFHNMNAVNIAFVVILLLCMVSLVLFIKELAKWLHKSKRDSSTLIKDILPESASLMFFSGMAIYYLGYDYQGSGANFLTLLIRSALSAFEMFLSKSNLIGIADNCKANPLYMFLFAFVHASALMVSMIFAVTCFGKRVKDWIRAISWSYSSKQTTINVFWGINEKSIILAKDIYLKSDGKDKIIFIDFPNDEENAKTGQSFSGIMGLLTYKTVVAKQLSNIKYLMLKSSASPLSIDMSTKGLLDNLGIGRLNKLMRKAQKVNYFVLTDNEVFNIQVSLNLLDSEIGKDISHLFCSARRTKEISIHEDCWKDGKLRLIDDSRESVMELAMRKNKKGEFYTHPINYVAVNSDLGCVETAFNALIIGFGTTGQDAFRFLYEFSAFPDADGNKSETKFFICDGHINNIKGNLYQEIPALPQLEQEGEVEFFPYHSGTIDFYKQLNAIINQLNVVVIATGNDEQNLDIASRIYEFALQYREKELERFKIFVRMYDSKHEYIFKKTVQAYSKLHAAAIEYFGSPNDIYTKRRIIDDEEGRISEIFYKTYCKVSGSECLEYKDRRKHAVQKEATQLLGYRRLNRELFQDRANSKHCYTKEVLLGLHKNSKYPTLPQWPIKADGRQSEEENKWITKLINVSICEHLRWNASHLMMGYVRMPTPKGSSSCDEKRKQHLCIVNWNELPQKPDYKEYDYMVVKTTINMYYES